MDKAKMTALLATKGFIFIDDTFHLMGDVPGARALCEKLATHLEHAHHVDMAAVVGGSAISRIKWFQDWRKNKSPPIRQG